MSPRRWARSWPTWRARWVSACALLMHGLVLSGLLQLAPRWPPLDRLQVAPPFEGVWIAPSSLSSPSPARQAETLRQASSAIQASRPAALRSRSPDPVHPSPAAGPGLSVGHARSDPAPQADAAPAPGAASLAGEQAVAPGPGAAASTAEPPAPTAQAAPPEARVDARPDHAYNPPPDYPLALREQGIGGVVWLRVWVDVEGRAAEVRLARGSGYRLLDEAAVRAVRQWRFIPARSGDQTQASWVEFPIRFVLKG